MNKPPYKISVIIKNNGKRVGHRISTSKRKIFDFLRGAKFNYAYVKVIYLNAYPNEKDCSNLQEAIEGINQFTEKGLVKYLNE